MAEIQFDIEQELGTLSEGTKGWKKEFNLIRWNGRPAKYDIRDWGPNHEKTGKGITLHRDELLKLREILNQMEI